MPRLKQLLPFRKFVALAVIGLLAPASLAQAASQTLRLAVGWNAVHLDVVPTGSVGEIMGGVPVDLVTTFYPEKQRVTALHDPAAEVWKNAEWRTWQAEGGPGAFLNNLHALEGGRAYLIRATAAATLTLTGAPATGRLRWQAQAFNFTGLPADPDSPATFAGFFAHSPAHLPLRAYRLVTGKWQPVTPTEPIKRGAAYWIWCDEGSEFQGPLDLRPDGPGVIAEGGSFAVKLLGVSGLPLPVRVSATGSLALGITPPDGFRSAALPAEVPAGAGEPLSYRFTTLGVPVSGESAVVDFRAAGVRISLPVTVGDF